MAGLSQVFAVIQANMVARQSGLNFYVGARNLGRNTGGNTVIFVPTSDSFEPGSQMDSPTYTRPTTVAGPPIKAQRLIRKKMAGFSVYLWGVPTSRMDTRVMDGTLVNEAVGDRTSLEQVETMIDTLICACHEATTGPNLVIGAGHWADQEGQATSEYGALYMLEMSVAIPVIYEESRILTPTAVSAPVRDTLGHYGS